MKIDNTYPDNLIHIGRSAIENDTLLDKSDPDDLWFHLQAFPSCHVILKYNPDSKFTNEMIRYCCKITKDHTKYKNVPNIKVEYIELKYIRKTNILGTVILTKKPKVVVC